MLLKLRPTGLGSGAQALRHDSLGAQLASVLEHQGALGVRHMLIPGRGLVGGGREAGLDEFGVGGKAPRGPRPRVESERLTARRIDRVARRDEPLSCSALSSLNPAGWPLRGFPYLESPTK
jgi:hypothetical protein